MITTMGRVLVSTVLAGVALALHPAAGRPPQEASSVCFA